MELVLTQKLEPVSVSLKGFLAGTVVEEYHGSLILVGKRGWMYITSRIRDIHPTVAHTPKYEKFVEYSFDTYVYGPIINHGILSVKR